MKESLKLLLVPALVACFGGCQTASSGNRDVKTETKEKESTVFLCIETKSPDSHTDMIDFKQSPRITEFNYLSPERILFGSRFSKEIYALNGNEKTLKTANLPNGEKPSAFSFINAQDGILIDEKYNLWKTPDGGNNWNKITELKSFADQYAPPAEIKFSSLDKGVLFSGDKDVFETEDGGKNWTAVKIPAFADRVVLAGLHDKTTWIGYGKNSTEMYVLSRDGEKWKQLIIKTTANYSDPETIFLLNAKTGWISSDIGEIFATQDNGTNWEKINVPANIGSIRSMFWNDWHNGWIAGSNKESQAILYKTADGGQNWELVETKNEGFFDKIYFAGSNNGWLISRERIYRSSDNGKTWNSQVYMSFSCQKTNS